MTTVFEFRNIKAEEEKNGFDYYRFEICQKSDEESKYKKEKQIQKYCQALYEANIIHQYRLFIYKSWMENGKEKRVYYEENMRPDDVFSVGSGINTI